MLMASSSENIMFMQTMEDFSLLPSWAHEYAFQGPRRGIDP
jgi:hypothetical protein